MKHSLAALLLVVFTVACFVGCEQGGNHRFHIEPAEVSLGSGQTIKFVATGGLGPYTWTMKNEGLGELAGSGQTITYLATVGSTVTGTNITNLVYQAQAGTNGVSWSGSPTILATAINTIIVTDNRGREATAIVYQGN